MSQVVERFLRYVSFDTQSSEDGTTVPSTEKQFALARHLYQELVDMGVPQVRLDEEHGYVYAKLPSNLLTRSYVPPVGFIAHMDTSPAVSGAGVSPRRVSNYDGKDIQLSENVALSVAENPELMQYVGQDLLVTDGKTLLGADDKAGIAEIMEMAAHFLQNPELCHGDICIAFTPDEEIGRGVDYFDVEGFGAAYAYTVDGGAIGEIEYENFNALNIELHIHGRSVHPGDAKGKMKNALLIGMEFQQLLPTFDNPAYTEGYEGFYHLDSMEGSVEHATMNYIIRDHDAVAFAKKVDFIEDVMKFLNKKYGPETVMYIETATYRNMREMIEPHMFLIDQAKEAMESVGIVPKVVPIRGGTDGARLSFMGLPCPNLCAGGHNFHGTLEYIPVPSLEKITEFLVALSQSFAPQA